MIYKRINLKDFYKNLKYDVFLTAYCPDNSKEIEINRVRPTILLLPGGGYYGVSDRENEPIALRFLGYDFNVFSLKYSTNPNTDFPYPIVEGYAAIDFIRKNSLEFNVDKNRVFAMGFSAGGHFAAMLACRPDDEFYKKYLEIENPEFTINGCVLGYPVISCDPVYGETGTRHNLVSKNPDKLTEYYSVNKHITDKFPKTFIFAFDGDNVVNPKNTEILVELLKKNNVKVEKHIYHGTAHGTSLADRSVYSDNIEIDSLKDSQEWPLLAINFLLNNN